MGTIETLDDQATDDLMSLTQRALEVLHGNSSARRKVVSNRADPTTPVEEVFVLAWGWGISLDGDNYWVQTYDSKWHLYDACNAPVTVARGFTTEMNKLIQWHS